jgi:hypothetical protein
MGTIPRPKGFPIERKKHIKELKNKFDMGFNEINHKIDMGFNEINHKIDMEVLYYNPCQDSDKLYSRRGSMFQIR